MLTALNAAASGMKAQQSEIESISNNLANVQTTGYKKTRAEFQDLLYETLQEPGAKTSAQTQSPVGIQRGLGVRVAGVQRTFTLGAPKKTSRDLDMMIKGDGFLVIETPSGEMAYTRDGSLHRSAQGRIETLNGYPVQPEMFIPRDARGVEISEDGIVSVVRGADREQIGQLQLAKFVNNGGLKAIGQNLYRETPGSGPPNYVIPGTEQTGGIMQRYLETSNVSPIEEMTSMIKAQRAFEMNSKVIQAVDQILQQTSSIR